LDIGFLPLGYHPTATRADMPWMPKGRYAIMRRYMPKVGTLGLDMMTRTCTVQVNLDYSSEQDMVRKLRVSLLLQPLATALFANSPFSEGRPNGYLSFRAQVWTDTDNDRAGIPRVMFEPGFGFERYVEWLVDTVPMYFVYRGGEYIDDMMVAQSAFWVGLLYDDPALAAAEALLRDVTWQDAVALRAAVPREGLAARWGDGVLRDLAREVLPIARDGLRARRKLDGSGRDEAIYLEPLEGIVAGEPTQAEHWLARFHQAWQGNVRRIFSEGAI
jgi:glutamate--cysteine ligase